MLTKPTEKQISSFLEAARDLPLSYAEEGATRAKPPNGYLVDRNRIIVGNGSEKFLRAQAALKGWKQFELGWVRAVPDTAPLTEGTVVAVVVNHFHFWSMNACRIIYTIDEQTSPVRRFGFAYGTLLTHVERGEERFTIEWNTESDEVWYDILAFSRPRHWLAKIGYPVTRWWQKRFARDSMQAMVREVDR